MLLINSLKLELYQINVLTSYLKSLKRNTLSVYLIFTERLNKDLFN